MLISLGTFRQQAAGVFHGALLYELSHPGGLRHRRSHHADGRSALPRSSASASRTACSRFAVDHTEQRRNIFSVGVYTILAGAVLLVAICPLLGLFRSLTGSSG